MTLSGPKNELMRKASFASDAKEQCEKKTRVSNERCKVVQEYWQERLTKDGNFCSMRKGKGRHREKKKKSGLN